MANTVNLLSDGSIEIRFAQPLKNSTYAAFFFGNVRGVTLEVLNNQIIGVIFADEEALESFYRFNGLPGLGEVKRIVRRLRRSE